MLTFQLDSQVETIPDNLKANVSNLDISDYSKEDLEKIISVLEAYTIKPIINTENRATKEYKIVGVTFSNDNGTDRQALISKHTGNMFFIPYEYNDKLAIAIINSKGNILGNFEESEIEKFTKYILNKENTIAPFYKIVGGDNNKSFGIRIKFYKV